MLSRWVADWHRQLNDPTLADAIRFELHGTSMRTEDAGAGAKQMKAAGSRASRGRTVSPLRGVGASGGIVPQHGERADLVEGGRRREQRRFGVRSEDDRPRPVLPPRDRFIGWTPQLREKNLPLAADYPRFLILPWITIPNLGSRILSLVRRQLPHDWTERYNITPVLIETFVETPRFTGALQGVGLDPRRNHPGTRAIRPPHQARPTEEGHLAAVLLSVEN